MRFEQPKSPCTAEMPVILRPLSDEEFKDLQCHGQPDFDKLGLQGPDTVPTYAIVDSHNSTVGVVAACTVTEQCEYLGCRYAVVYRFPCYAGQRIGQASREQVEELHPGKWICIADPESKEASMVLRLGYCLTEDQIRGYNSQIVFIRSDSADDS